MVADERECAGGHVFEERPCRIGEDQIFDAERRHGLDGRAHDRSVAMLVIMRAALHGEDAGFANPACDNARGMA